MSKIFINIILYFFQDNSIDDYDCLDEDEDFNVTNVEHKMPSDNEEEISQNSLTIKTNLQDINK